MRRGLLGLGLLCVAAAPPRFDPRDHKYAGPGAPNQVAVLGTPHLSEMKAAPTPDALAPLMARLGAWAPQAIAVEAVAGPQCDEMRRYPDRYRESVDMYCADTAAARAATGLDVPAATAAAERMLAAWPARPTPADRRRLAATFLAAGDSGSALVQWLRLPVAERHAGDGLDAALASRLDHAETRQNEVDLLAAPLAAALGLERLFPMDDHSSDTTGPDDAAAGKVVSALWENPATAARKAMDERLAAALGQPGGLLALYRAYNAPDQAPLIYASDFGAALGDRSPQAFGRQYEGSWEVRNLRMAANIREMLAARPGIRALVIVGASHKPYLEAYLDEMHDVEIVDVERLLR